MHFKFYHWDAIKVTDIVNIDRKQLFTYATNVYIIKLLCIAD